MAPLAQRLIPQMVSPGALPEGLRLAEFSRSQVPSANHQRALDALASFGQQRELGQIRVPTLLIGGEFDRVDAPAAMRQMAAATRHARCAEPPGIGHLMNLEALDGFDALLFDFLRELLPNAPAGLH
jgi:pimeloyl-ACP methyl ester carboxylesterase